MPTPTLSLSSPRVGLGAAVVTCALVVVMVVSGGQQITKANYDDFLEFHAAASAMRSGHDIYAPDVGKLGYVYPPLLAFLLQPLGALSIASAAWVWLALKAVLLAGALVLGSREAARRTGVAMTSTHLWVLSAISLALVADKVRGDFRMGQSNLLMLHAWLLGLVFLDRKPWLSGVALGFGANLKYVTLLAVPYLLLRGRFTAALSTLLSSLAWALLPAISLGWTGNLDALRRALAGLSGLVGARGENEARVMGLSDQLSVSITSAVARWCEGSLPPAASAGIVLALAATFASIVILLIRRGGHAGLFRNDAAAAPAALVLAEWCVLIILSLAFSPQTNTRHLAILLPVFAAAIALRFRAGLTPAGRRLTLAVFVTTLATILPTNGTPDALAWWRANSGISWCLLGLGVTLIGAAAPVRRDRA